MSDKYDYSKEAKNLYKKNRLKTPAIPRLDKQFATDTAYWNKQFEKEQRDWYYEQKQKQAIAKNLLAGFMGTKKVIQKKHEVDWQENIKGYTEGISAPRYEPFGDQPILQRVEGIGRGGTAAGGDFFGTKLEFIPEFEEYLNDMGNYHQFIQSERGQMIMDTMVREPKIFDRMPGMTGKQWGDLEESGLPSSDWTKYIKEQAGEGVKIWEDSPILDPIEINTAPIIEESDYDFESSIRSGMIDEDSFLSETEEMLDYIDSDTSFWWTDELWTDTETGAV